MRIRPTRVGSHTGALPDDPDDKERDKETDETPETPPDEPRPPRVQDPPPQPDTKGPYVV
jgi:hypothetical protein